MLTRLSHLFRQRLGRDPLVPLALAAGIGIQVADRTEGLLPLGVFLGIAVMALALACARPRFPGLLALGTASIFALGQAVALWQIGQFPFSPNLANGDALRLEAEGLVIREPAAPGAGNTRSGRCVIRFTAMKVGGITFHCDQALPVRLVSPNERLRYGDRIRSTGLLLPFSPPRSPGAFDPARFFRRSLGASGEMVIGSGDRIQILERDAGNPFIATAIRSRHAIERHLTRGLEDQPDTAAVIKAMALGSREDTPEHIEEQFRLSGAMHVFAVSGLHVGIFLGFLWGLLRWLRVPRRYAVFILVPAILFYATITGLRPSAVRAAIMGSVVLLGFVAERKPRLLNSLAFAALLILALDTQQLFRPGFQLSFAVLTAIALLYEPFHASFSRLWKIDPFLPSRLVPRWRLWLGRGGDKAAQLLALSLAAWLGSVILVIYHFQILTPVAVIANLVMVPFATFVLALSGTSLLVSLLGGSSLAAQFLNPGIGYLVKGGTLAAGFFASLPGGYLHVSPSTWLDRPASSEPTTCRITLTEPTITGLSQLWSFYRPDHRQAHWLIDPGDPVGFANAGQPMLRHHAVNRLQTLVLSHGDFDHVGAAPTVIERFPLGAVITGDFEGRSPSIPHILDSIARTAVPHLKVARGDRIPIDPHTELTILYPPREEVPPSTADDRCLVMLLRHHEWRLLYTADSGFLTEKWLLENETRGLKADLWIKAWRAGDLSGLAEFLDRVDPAALITTNHDFPSSERISGPFRNQLEARGVTLFDLTTDGAVELKLSPSTLRAELASPRNDGPSLRLKK